MRKNWTYYFFKAEGTKRFLGLNRCSIIVKRALSFRKRSTKKSTYLQKFYKVCLDENLACCLSNNGGEKGRLAGGRQVARGGGGQRMRNAIFLHKTFMRTSRFFRFCAENTNVGASCACAKCGKLTHRKSKAAIGRCELTNCRRRRMTKISNVLCFVKGL